MELNEIRTLVDFGMVVVLWLVQLVIYPSFLQCEPARLIQWHQTYTSRVSWVIIPLMFTQLPLVAWMAWQAPSVGHVLAFAAVLGCWGLTFAVAVPCTAESTPVIAGSLSSSAW